jgi:hypothetical protein
MEHLPSVRHLRHLIALADHAHFGRAAEAVFVTQSTLSASIKELENLLEATLVDRSKRSVVLTPLGLETVERARKIIADCEGAAGENFWPAPRLKAFDFHDIAAVGENNQTKLTARTAPAETSALLFCDELLRARSIRMSRRLRAPHQFVKQHLQAFWRRTDGMQLVILLKLLADSDLFRRQRARVFAGDSGFDLEHFLRSR